MGLELHQCSVPPSHQTEPDTYIGYLTSPPLIRRRARRGIFLGRNWSANLAGMLAPEEVNL
jgi:hypothetical protein